MVNAAYGFDGTLTEVQESHKVIRTSESYNGMRVWSGGEVTPGTGRAVNVAALDGLAAGIYFTTDATSVALTANTGSTRRIDSIVAVVDWAANTVTIDKVTGVASAAPVPPALTQVVGGTWHMPLARVTVQPNASSIATADIQAAAPRPGLLFLPYSATVNTAATITGNASAWSSLGSVTAVDPGRPYRVQVSASVRFAQTTSDGYMRIRALDVDTNTVYGEGVTDRLNTGRGVANLTAQVSASSLTGTRRVRLEMTPQDMAAGQTVEVTNYAGTHFTVLLLPA